MHALPDLRIATVTASDRARSRTWNATIAKYHYLGYQRILGHQIRYQISSHERPLALIGFASAA